MAKYKIKNKQIAKLRKEQEEQKNWIKLKEEEEPKIKDQYYS